MLFYVSYDCNRTNVWYECSLAVIKKKKEGDIYEKNSSKKGICSSVRTYYVW